MYVLQKPGNPGSFHGNPSWCIEKFCFTKNYPHEPQLTLTSSNHTSWKPQKSRFSHSHPDVLSQTFHSCQRQPLLCVSLWNGPSNGIRHFITLTLFLVSLDKPSRPTVLEHLISSHPIIRLLFFLNQNLLCITKALDVFPFWMWRRKVFFVFVLWGFFCFISWIVTYVNRTAGSRFWLSDSFPLSNLLNTRSHVALSDCRCVY